MDRTVIFVAIRHILKTMLFSLLTVLSSNDDLTAHCCCQDCSRSPRVWDETDAAGFSKHSGGACLDTEQARHKLAANNETMEMVSVDLVSDPQNSSIFGGVDDGKMVVWCLRWKDRARDHDLQHFFGQPCEMSRGESLHGPFVPTTFEDSDSQVDGQHSYPRKTDGNADLPVRCPATRHYHQA